MPPISVPSASARSPRLMSLGPTARPVIAPRARNMPVASMNTMVTTRHIVRHGTRWKVGRPNRNGRTSAQPGLVADAGEIGPAERDRRDIAHDDADQHGGIGQEAEAEADDQQDREQHEAGDPEVARCSEIGGVHAAAGPVPPRRA